MPCVIPIRIINPHYKKIASELNEDVYQYEGRDNFYIDVPCGQCINCLQSKGNSWSLRLNLEYKYLTPHEKKHSYFLTMTLSDDYINEDKSLLIRRYLERIRKHLGHSCRHWFISEYGSKTQRFHYHGLIFNFPNHKLLLSLWKYGHIVIKPLSPRRIGYVCTYVNKNLKNSNALIEDPRYKQKIWCSPGLGKAVVNDKNVTSTLRVNGSPSPFMKNTSNRLVAIPRYLRQKFYTEDELETIQQAYFFNLSDDVIPPGPYKIGKRIFTNYLVYLEECNKLKQKRNYINKLYGKRITQSAIQTIGYRLSRNQES